MFDKKIGWQFASRFQSLLVLVLMIVAMSFLSDKFLTPANGWNIMRQISVNVCLSIGMTLVILSGGIDLSVGSVLAFASAITAGLIKSLILLPWIGMEIQFTTLGAIVAGLVVGSLLGYFNGLMITRVKIPPFVATLAMLSIARGMTMLWTKGFPITGLGDHFAVIGNGLGLRDSCAGVDCRGPRRRLCRDHQEDATWPIHLRRRRQRTNRQALGSKRGPY